MMDEERPYLLTIAGFDPSGGAGILADIKAFEINKVIGQAVCTALTFQNEKEFDEVKWVSTDDIIKQMDVLMRVHRFQWVKIGLIKDLESLDTITAYLLSANPDVKIIWDPILKASAGFEFHDKLNDQLLKKVLSRLFLVTPNAHEMQKMCPVKDIEEAALELSGITNILLKGGHRAGDGDKVKDMLFQNEGTCCVFESKRSAQEKHGTGCVLSAAILTNLAKGYDLEDACKEGKEYVTEYINSHNSLLGFHYV